MIATIGVAQQLQVEALQALIQVQEKIESARNAMWVVGGSDPGPSFLAVLDELDRANQAARGCVKHLGRAAETEGKIVDMLRT